MTEVRFKGNAWKGECFIARPFSKHIVKEDQKRARWIGISVGIASFGTIPAVYSVGYWAYRLIKFGNKKPIQSENVDSDSDLKGSPATQERTATASAPKSREAIIEKLKEKDNAVATFLVGLEKQRPRSSIFISKSKVETQKRHSIHSPFISLKPRPSKPETLTPFELPSFAPTTLRPKSTEVSAFGITPSITTVQNDPQPRPTAEPTEIAALTASVASSRFNSQPSAPPALSVPLMLMTFVSAPQPQSEAAITPQVLERAANGLRAPSVAQLQPVNRDGADAVSYGFKNHPKIDLVKYLNSSSTEESKLRPDSEWD